MMGDLISIIVPVFNVEDYLRFTLDSIIAQTYQNWEMILVDDGSTDNSSKICDEYARNDIRIRVFHIKNSGVSHARNFGLDEAKGEYIIFCDSDDLMDEHTLEFLFEQHYKSHADIVSCSYKKIDENVTTYKSMSTMVPCEIVPNAMMETLRHDYWDVVWAKLYKREIIEQNQLRFAEDMYLSEDTLFCELCSIRSKMVINLPMALIGYRQRIGSITKSGKSFFFQALKRYRYLEKLEKTISQEDICQHIYRWRKEGAFIDLMMWLYTPKKSLCSIKEEVQYLHSQKDLFYKLKSLNLENYTKRQQIFFFLLKHLGKTISPIFIYMQQRIDRV